MRFRIGSVRPERQTAHLISVLRCPRLEGACSSGTSSPCRHGGTCLDRWSWQQCRCVDGFTGRFCEKCRSGLWLSGSNDSWWVCETGSWSLKPAWSEPPASFNPEPLAVKTKSSKVSATFWIQCFNWKVFWVFFLTKSLTQKTGNKFYFWATGSVSVFWSVGSNRFCSRHEPK